MQSMINLDVDPIENRPRNLIEIDILKYCLNDWSHITAGRPVNRDWKIEVGTVFLTDLYRRIEEKF
jgi:hypothetical protein